MKLSDINKIAHDILQEVSCPKCKSPFIFNSQKIGIIELNNKKFTFSVPCSNCHTLLTVDGEFKNQLVSAKSAVNSRIDEQSIKNISESLERFQGKNVKDLFI